MAVIVGVGLRAYLVDRAWVHTRNLGVKECGDSPGDSERERERRESERERRERDGGKESERDYFLRTLHKLGRPREGKREARGEGDATIFGISSWCTAMKGEKGYQAVFKAIFRVDTRNALGVRVPLGAPWCARSSARSKGSAGEE